MGLLSASDAQYEQLKAQLVQGVQPLVHGEDVIAVSMLRRGGFAGQVLAAQVSGVAYAATALLRRKKAGGLPESVVVAVTPTRIYAFSHKVGGRNHGAPKEEVAMWERSQIQVSTETKMGMTNITIVSAGEGESVTLVPFGVSDDPMSSELITLLANAHGSGPQTS